MCHKYLCNIICDWKIVVAWSHFLDVKMVQLKDLWKELGSMTHNYIEISNMHCTKKKCTSVYSMVEKKLKHC